MRTASISAAGAETKSAKNRCRLADKQQQRRAAPPR